ncbi:MAG: hypothetical protein KY439_07130 [Actinobacteria bacterium]|nr:hypothetical protein [Actinomycetota bacterium]
MWLNRSLPLSVSSTLTVQAPAPWGGWARAERTIVPVALAGPRRSRPAFFSSRGSTTSWSARSCSRGVVPGATVVEVVAAAAPGTLVIDGTTIGPEAAREFGATAREHGLRYVDAPVAGSTGPAADGILGVLVGGAQEDYDDALPLLHLWGAPEKVRRVGDVGAGSALKLCVNQGLGVMAGTRVTQVSGTLANGQLVGYPAPAPLLP